MVSLKDLLIKHEGIRLCKYKCPAGYWTIGVGRNLETKGLSVEEGRFIGTQQPNCITMSQAMYLLDNDIRDFTDDLTDELDWFAAAHPIVKIVLVDMAVNLGVGGLMKFTNTLLLLKNKQYLMASKEMLNSNWAKQVKGRAVELSNLIASIK